jgi:hypothetical protein
MTLEGLLVEFKIEPVFIKIRDSLSCLLFALPMFFLHSGIADVKTELNFVARISGKTFTNWFVK